MKDYCRVRGDACDAFASQQAHHAALGAEPTALA